MLRFRGILRATSDKFLFCFVVSRSLISLFFFFFFFVCVWYLMIILDWLEQASSREIAQQRYVVRLTCSYFFFFFFIREKWISLRSRCIYRFAIWLDILVFFAFFFFYYYYAARLVTSVVSSAQIVIQPRRKRIQLELYNDMKKERNKEKYVWPCIGKATVNVYACWLTLPRSLTIRFDVQSDRHRVVSITGSFQINQNDSRVNSVKVWRSTPRTRRHAN